MLVLTRKLQEQIVIGDNIKVTILRVRGNTVRLGIEAPRQVRVIRAELPTEDASSESEATATPAANDSHAASPPTRSAATGRLPAGEAVPRLPPPLANYLLGLTVHAS